MPITSVLQLLWNYKVWLFVVVLGVALYVEHTSVSVEKLAKEKAQLQVSQLTTSLETSNVSIKTLQASIDSQNAAIDALRMNAASRLANAQIALAKAKVQSTQNTTNAGIILGRSEPKDKPVCESANDLINQELNRAKK